MAHCYTISKGIPNNLQLANWCLKVAKREAENCLNELKPGEELEKPINIAEICFN